MKKTNISTFKLILLAITPFVLWFLPSTLLDGDKFPFCPSRVIFNIECLGCGMTRAVMHFHHFEYEKAISYNMGVVLVYPLLIWVWFRWIREASRKSRLFLN